MADPQLEALVRYHGWHSQRLLDTASLASAEELDDGNLSHGSILTTLRHLADVNQSWRCAAEGTDDLSVEQMEALKDLPSLREFFLRESDHLLKFVQSLTPADLEREVTPHWRNAPIVLTK